MHVTITLNQIHLGEIGISKTKTVLKLNTYSRRAASARYLLGVRFFQQGTPEFVFGLGMRVDQFSVARRQKIVDDNVRPSSKTPKAEVENTSMLLAPILFFVIRNNLAKLSPKLLYSVNFITGAHGECFLSTI